MTVQMVIALAIVILMIAMMKAGSLGEIAYITPCIATAVLGLMKVFEVCILIPRQLLLQMLFLHGAEASFQ